MLYQTMLNQTKLYPTRLNQTKLYQIKLSNLCYSILILAFLSIVKPFQSFLLQHCGLGAVSGFMVWHFSSVNSGIFGRLIEDITFAKNERGYRLTAINNRFWSLLIFFLSVASIMRKLLKTTHTEESSDHKKSRKMQHSTRIVKNQFNSN